MAGRTGGESSVASSTVETSLGIGATHRPIEFFYFRDDTSATNRTSIASLKGMEKPAITDHPIHELLHRRWSPLAFDGRPIPREMLYRLFEAARWAASSYNEQPWSYIIGLKSEDPDQFDKLASTLLPGNSWAKDAPVLALSVARNTFTHNGAPNRVAVHDVGAASASLTFEATYLGIFVHQMGGFDVDKSRRIFEIPDGYDPVAMLAIGFPGNPDNLEEALRKREEGVRRRKDISKFVFTGKWDERPF